MRGGGTDGAGRGGEEVGIGRERGGDGDRVHFKENFQLQQSGVLRRIDSSNMTVEEWTTPLLETCEKKGQYCSYMCGIDISYMYMYIYFAVQCAYMHVHVLLYMYF